MGDRTPEVSRFRDVLGIAWVVLAAVAVLAPALRPGHSLGPFDILSRSGLTYQPHVPVHGPLQIDQILQFVPWTDLAWHQVHSGQLPLWNTHSLLGMPLAFNWQSAVFSLPVALSYLFPVHLAYTVIVLAKLAVAGTGVYVLCRVLGLRPLAAAFGGVAFELSGPIIVHAGWSMVGVTAWTGWILAGVVLVLRSRRPLGGVLLLSASVALAVYGGHPESLVVVGVLAALFVAVHQWSLAAGARWHPGRLGLLGLAGVLGAGLGAPLLLPGAQLGLVSARGSSRGVSAISPVHLPNLLGAFSGSDPRFGVYLGVTVLCLAVAGARVSWARPEVRALAAVAGAGLLLAFVQPLDSLLQLVPGGRSVTWNRAVMVLALASAVLAAFGVDALARRRAASSTDRAGADTSVLVRWLWGAVLANALLLLLTAAWGALGVSSTLSHNLDKLVWPLAESVVLVLLLRALGASAGRTRSPRLSSWSARRAAPILVVAGTVALVPAGASFWSVRSGYFPQTAATAQFQAAVGDALVARGTCTHVHGVAPEAADLGIPANANVAYNVTELWVYDPIVPESYLRLSHALTGKRIPKKLVQLGNYCLPVTSASEARLIGAQFLLEPPDRTGPDGTEFAGTVGGQDLYRVQGSSTATLVAAASRRAGPTSWDAPGSPVALRQMDDRSWRAAVQAGGASLLRIRLTAVPGWRASIDGRPLALRSWADGTMLEARVPAGHHVVELRYWPVLFSAGLVVAVVAGAAWLIVAALAIARRQNQWKAGLPPRQTMTSTLPTTLDAGTVPQKRLSSESPLQSPMTK